MKIQIPIACAAILLVSGCGQKAAETKSLAKAPTSTTSTEAVYSESNSESMRTTDGQVIERSASHSNSYGGGNVEYYNPSTGTQSTYSLDVEYDGNGDVEQINFSHGGYIDESHIASQEHNGDGTITVETDNGAEFTVDESEDYDGEQEN